MRPTYQLFILAGLIAASSIGSADSPEDRKGKKTASNADDKPIVVPFELLPSRHIAVSVKVNGKGPYRLIFDTGAPMNLINNKLAKNAGVLDPKAKKPSFGLFGAMGQHEMKTLEIGGAKLERVSAVVMDHPTVTLISEALGPIDGIIGFPFFARYKMTVDYQKKELTLIPSGYVPGDYMEGLMKKLMAAQQDRDPAIIAPSAIWGMVVAKEKDDEEAGVVIEKVLRGGAAGAAGLEPDDRVLTIDGRWTDTLSDAFEAASYVKPGHEVVVAIKRKGKEIKLTVKPAKGA